MPTPLEHILTHSYKADMIAYLKSHPKNFEEAIKLALTNKPPYSWRASWLLWSCMEKNDRRLQKYVRKFVTVLSTKPDNLAREYLMILQRCEGRLFDACIGIWEQTERQPSTRVNAWKILREMTKKYPELEHELSHLTEPRYLETLSAGTTNSVSRLAESIKAADA